MGAGDNVVYLETGRTSVKGLQLVDRLAAVTAAQLGSALRSALDEVDDALFARAERAGSNADQEIYFVAMRQVRLHRRDLERRFSDHVAARFAALTAVATPELREPAAEFDLALVDEAQVEEDVAVDTAAARVRGRHAPALAELVARLDRLVGERRVEDANSPLDPGVVVRGFRAALAGIDIDIQPRIILYKLFEKQLLLRYARLCQEANRLLADAGIPADLKAASTKTASDERRDSEAADGQAAGRELCSEGSDLVGTIAGIDETDILQTLELLIARAKQARAPVATRAMATAESGQIVHVLSSLQQQAAAASTGAAVDANRLKALINRGLARSGAPEHLGPAADDTIDIVSMLFDVILDDRRLHGSIRALISRLQIPVIKAALLDRSIFASRQHPVRQLINELAHAAIGWNEPEDPDGDPLYRKMSAVVSRVIDEFADDARVFETALQDFRLYLERERERARVIEDRTRQAAEGKARVDDAREQVQTEVEQRLSGWEPPPVIRSLLEEAWFKVLFITAVKEGPGSEAWRRQLRVMDQLVWSVAPKTDREQRRRMLAEMPELLHALREGLNGIMFNPFEMTRLFRELEAEHLKCLAELPVPAPEAQPPDMGRAPLLRDDPQPPAPLRPTDGDGVAGLGNAEAGAEAPPEDVPEHDELVQRLRELDLGTWFELQDAQGHETRAKLSARLNRGRRFVFVNRAGFKVADRGIATLLAELRDGRAAILDDNTLFDRALESVIGSLRDLRTGQDR
jgi:hypothetical protein